MKILISGLTAAGKTTTADLISEMYGLPVISWLSTMREVIADRHPELAALTVFSEAHDAIRRQDDRIDQVVDDRLLARARAQGDGVFDAWALPWRLDVERISIWIESDERSRVRKSVVSRQMRGLAAEADPAAALRRKDEFAAAKFRRLYGFDIVTDRDPFDIIINNERLIPTATEEAAKAGIERIKPVVQQCLEAATGVRPGIDAAHVPFVPRCRHGLGR